MKKTKFTPISELGEHNLISKITSPFQLTQITTKVGIGDDSAVLSDLNEELIISTDVLVEGVHFDPMYTPLKHLGYKSVVVNISDVCAMNAVATHVLVSISISNKYSVEMIKEIYEGINQACKNYNIDLIGGDTSSSMSGLIISVTIIGKSTNEFTTYRSGAKPNDLLMVSGDLGAAYLGLQILEREKGIFETQDLGQPDLTKYSYVLERQLKPEPRTDVIRLLREKKIKPTSMIDISDGLASELHHISKCSSIGVKVFEERIPIKNTSRLVADELNLNPTSCALNGGEDYELLFTVPLELHDEVREIPSFVEIGHVTSTGLVEMVTTTNSVVNLPPNSWDTFKHI